MLTSAKKQAQDLSKKIARQMAQEPLEVLKSAQGQLSGEQINYYQERIAKETQEKKGAENKSDLASKEKAQSSRALQALERELEDIRIDKIFRELQRKISEGEEVYLENVSELTPEQKQVLKAQQEAVKVQRQQQMAAQGGSLVEPKSKRARGSWMQGGKKQAEKQQTRVEKPIPPSG